MLFRPNPIWFLTSFDTIYPLLKHSLSLGFHGRHSLLIFFLHLYYFEVLSLLGPSALALFKNHIFSLFRYSPFISSMLSCFDYIYSRWYLYFLTNPPCELQVLMFKYFLLHLMPQTLQTQYDANWIHYSHASTSQTSSSSHIPCHMDWHHLYLAVQVTNAGIIDPSPLSLCFQPVINYIP